MHGEFGFGASRGLAHAESSFWRLSVCQHGTRGNPNANPAYSCGGFSYDPSTWNLALLAVRKDVVCTELDELSQLCLEADRAESFRSSAKAVPRLTVWLSGFLLCGRVSGNMQFRLLGWRELLRTFYKFPASKCPTIPENFGTVQSALCERAMLSSIPIRMKGHATHVGSSVEWHGPERGPYFC